LPVKVADVDPERVTLDLGLSGIGALRDGVDLGGRRIIKKKKT
jgi:hypothetical protein